MPHRKIHRILKKNHPEAVRKIKKLFGFKYPKLFLLGTMIVLAYVIFSQQNFFDATKIINQLGYFGIFFSGALTAFGFTAPLGVGMLVTISAKDILLGTILGGLGATIADLLIFKTIKFSFMDEFAELEKTDVIKKIEKIVKKNKHVLIRHYLLYIFAGIVLATPLPDEIGVSMLAGLTTIKPFKFLLICFLLHSAFIFLLLLI